MLYELVIDQLDATFSGDKKKTALMKAKKVQIEIKKSEWLITLAAAAVLWIMTSGTSKRFLAFSSVTQCVNLCLMLCYAIETADLYRTSFNYFDSSVGIDTQITLKTPSIHSSKTVVKLQKKNIVNWT